MLGGLGMLFRWKKLAKDAGIDIYTEQRPNLVISAGYQVCWEKFCRYWDIEMRLVPLEKDHLSLNMDTVMDYVDDHTIGITAILGITYTCLLYTSTRFSVAFSSSAAALSPLSRACFPLAR